MPSIWVRKIDGGLDARRLPEATAGGSLLRATDGHMNRGGEFEKRAAFVPTYSLPSGTIGLAATQTSVTVFGSGANPGVPTGVAYQQLGASGAAKLVSWDLFGGFIYAVADNGLGVRAHYYNGTNVTDQPDGRARIFFNVSAGIGVDPPNGTVSLFVNGIPITAGPVEWEDNMAEVLAAAINTHISSPDYVSVWLSDTTVYIIAAVAGSASNGLAVTAVTTGNLIANFLPGVLAGGTDTTYSEPGNFVQTIGTKMYALSGPAVTFSAIKDPTDWDTGTGFGFIDMSQYVAGTEGLTALANYQNAVAVFSPRTILIWTLASDPASNNFLQTLRNTGTTCPRSVTGFGGGDVLYLDESGLRSLRARDSSNSASTTGLGVRIDPLIVAKLRSLTADDRAKIIGLVEPQDGRFWLIMKDTIFVFTYYPDEKISAWSTYTTHYFDDAGNKIDFDVDDAVVFNRRVYLRSGDMIFAYGGVSTGQERDEAMAEAWLPYLDGDDPGQQKTWQSFDAAISGQWAVAVGMSLRDSSVEEDICNIHRTTYNDESIGTVGQSTHLSLRFRSQGSGAAVLSACALHYTADEPDK